MSSPDGTPRLARPLGVVTGASEGIGHEIARELAERGHDLIIVAADDSIHDVAEQLGGGERVRSLQVDLATRCGNQAVIDVLDADGRRPSVAAIRAGSDTTGPLVDVSLEDHLRLLDADVVSTVMLGQQIAARMVAHGDGRILFGVPARRTAPGLLDATRTASASFVRSFSDGLRDAVRDDGVTVTALETSSTGQPATDTGSPATAEQDARDGVEALLAGHDHAGGDPRSTMLQVALAALVPDPVLTRIQARGASSPDA